MKKTMLLLGALMLTAAAGYAQESRMDASVSATVPFAPQITGNSVQKNTSMTLGLLASFRYMLTPRSALEVNYKILSITRSLARRTAASTPCSRSSAGPISST
jgi:outer membrane immunogenic protein